MPLTRLFSLLQFIAFVCAVLGCFWLGTGCEVESFDPRGYRCEHDLNCLPEYSCDQTRKQCVLTSSSEASASDGGEKASGDASVSDVQSKPEKTTPEPRPEPATTTETSSSEATSP